MTNIRLNMEGNDMTIIVGVGETGKKIKKLFLENEKNIVWYDNDRRKWGRTIENIKVITLDKSDNHCGAKIDITTEIIVQIIETMI